MIQKWKQRLSDLAESVNSVTVIGVLLTALVLIAGIGLGITSSGILDSPDTGHRPIPDPGEALKVQGGHATVTENGTVSNINLVIAKGGNEVDLSAVSITWEGPIESLTLVSGTKGEMNARSDSVEIGESQQFYISPIQDTDNSFPTLNADTDLFKLQLDATAIRGQPLTGGQTVALKFTTGDLGVVVYRIKLPSSLEGKSTVEI